MGPGLFNNFINVMLDRQQDAMYLQTKSHSPHFIAQTLNM